MAGLKQSKRVTWAPDVNLCQVRLFLSEDTPSQSGSGSQDHLQAKGSWLQSTREASSDDSLPPGFEAPLIPYLYNKGISEIPVVKWKSPFNFYLKREWLVVAGDESEEVGLQNQRQLGVFEAIYPRISSIPLNPILSELQDSLFDDAQTPLIPITAIEDEDLSDELDSQAVIDTSISVQHAEVPKNLTDIRTQSMLNLTIEGSVSNKDSCVPNLHISEKSVASFIPSAEPDVMAAASAAFTALIRSNEEGSLIDRDLLIRILSNPVLIEKLLSEYGTSRQNPPSVGAPTPVPPATSPPQTNLSAPLPAPPMGQFHPPQAAVLRPLTNPQASTSGFQVTGSPPVSGGAPVKDLSYFKTLIQQHGGDRQEVMDPLPSQPDEGHPRYPYKAVGGNSVEQGIQSLVHRDPKPKISKLCMYFNSPRGCRRGVDCLYVHDGSLPQSIERQSRKKIKPDRETTRKV